MLTFDTEVTILILLGISLVLPGSYAYFGLTAREPILGFTLDYDDNQIDRHSEFYTHRHHNHRARTRVSSTEICNKLHRKQRRMCRRGGGVAKALLKATKMSVLECQFQLQYERWNCTLGTYRQRLLRKGFKESSFLYAISSAGLVHAFSRGCSQGSIDRCTCDESKHLRNHEAWLWGGCGDNLRYGLKFTRRFLRRARRTGKDQIAKVNEHNSALGIKIVKERVETKCKCHGVSASCTAKTCWRQLPPFSTIGKLLKQKYEHALRVVSYTNRATGKSQLVKKRGNLTDRRSPRRGNLIYLDNSPSFCTRSRYSPGTISRVCHKDSDCKTLCCGRGYNVQSTITRTACQCKVVWCCYVECTECLDRNDIYTCK